MADVIKRDVVTAYLMVHDPDNDPTEAIARLGVRIKYNDAPTFGLRRSTLRALERIYARLGGAPRLLREARARAHAPESREERLRLARRAISELGGV